MCKGPGVNKQMLLMEEAGTPFSIFPPKQSHKQKEARLCSGDLDLHPNPNSGLPTCVTLTSNFALHRVFLICDDINGAEGRLDGDKVHKGLGIQQVLN